MGNRGKPTQLLAPQTLGAQLQNAQNLQTCSCPSSHPSLPRPLPQLLISNPLHSSALQPPPKKHENPSTNWVAQSPVRPAREVKNYLRLNLQIRNAQTIFRAPATISRKGFRGEPRG